MLKENEMITLRSMQEGAGTTGLKVDAMTKPMMARTLRAEPSALLIAIRFCSGASRQSIKRLQRAAVPASKLACTSAADPQRR